MRGRLRIEDESGRLVFSSLSDAETSAFSSGGDGLVSVDGRKTRLASAGVVGGRVYFASTDPDHLKSNRVFRASMEVLTLSFEYIRREIIAAEERAAGRSKRLVHNLTSLNGHMIQDLYSVIPQERLAGNLRRNVPIIATEIAGRPGEFARCFLSLAKHSTAMKNEFSVFKKIDSLEAEIDKKNHPVHKVMMNVAYLFFSEFADKGSYIEVAESQLKAPMDYECAFVAIYHLLDNAAKYICRGTTLDIRIDDRDGYARVHFDMCSLAIEAADIPELLKEGISGAIPDKLGLSGDGVGLSLIRRVMEMHEGRFSIEVDVASRFVRDGVEFQKNRFVLEFPL